MAEDSSKSCSFGGNLMLDNPEVVEVSPEVAAGWSFGHQKRKRAEVVSHDTIELDDDDGFEGVTINGVKKLDHNSKQAFGSPTDWPKNAKSGLTENVAGSSAIPIKVFYPSDGLGTNHAGTTFAGPSAIPAYSLDALGTYHGGKGLPDYSYNFFEKTKEQDNAYKEDEYGNYSHDTLQMESGSRFNLNVDYYMGFPHSVGSVVPWGHIDPTDMTHRHEQFTILDNKIDEKYKAFKKFDIADDHNDHYFAMPVKEKPSKDWMKRIQHEWKVLENGLPDTIFVRVYENRMDLLRAVIVGPADTPYHDGLFFFDVYFPSQYPSNPPLVNYRSGGLRPNPNLYACGRVCISLLNTWSGSDCERWNPSNSTMLQVLVSIQALVLNAKPYFNEPGYVMHANTPYGKKKSLVYNEETFLQSCRTMLYSIRNPPKHFEDFVGDHFRKYGRNILMACKAYMGGAQVAWPVRNGAQDIRERDKSCSKNFKGPLKTLFEDLMAEFANLGVDCHEFQDQIVNSGAARATVDTTLRL